MNKRNSPADYAMTTDEVAAALGLTRSLVSVIEVGAIRKLRKECAERGLTFNELFIGLKQQPAHVGHDNWGNGQ